jgi:hypothetical protein
MSAALPLDLEAEILTGAVRALRRRAAAIRERAAPGVTRLESYRPPVVIVTSESAHALRIARDFYSLADSLESEVRR